MTARYNLIIIHVPRLQHVSDFLTIRNILVGRAPDIETHILTAGEEPPDFWSRAAALPSLIFSPMPVRFQGMVRGARLMNAAMTKLAEIELLQSAGLPVPKTQTITPETRLDEVAWGPFTVVKPNRGHQGKGVRLTLTRDVRWSDTATLPKDDPRHGLTLLAQRFIDTGPRAESYRVMTVLGRPVYAVVSRALADRPALNASGSMEMEIAANSSARTMALTREADVIKLAKAVHTKLNHVPVMGIDIIREKKTGRLFVLELNSIGYTWHLSSDYGLGHQRKFGLDYYGQFGALDIIADALIDATRRLAT